MMIKTRRGLPKNSLMAPTINRLDSIKKRNIALRASAGEVAHNAGGDCGGPAERRRKPLRLQQFVRACSDLHCDAPRAIRYKDGSDGDASNQ